MTALTENEISQHLKKVDGWSYSNKVIGKEFEFKDFKEALNFVNKVGEKAEAKNHHPDIFLHDWNKVKITLSTHSESGITEKDFSLANDIEGI